MESLEEKTRTNSLNAKIEEDIEREISSVQINSELGENLEDKLENLKKQFLNEFYKLRFGDSKIAYIKRKVALIYANLSKMDFNSVNELYFNLQKNILAEEVNARDESYKKYNYLRNEFFKIRSEGEKQNKRVNIALEMLKRYEDKIDDLNKFLEYKSLREVDSTIEQPELSSIILSEYEDKTPYEINKEITALSKKAYEIKNFIETEKLKFVETTTNLASLKKALIIQEALYSKQEKRVREISNAMSLFHDKYINFMFELLIREARRMNSSDRSLKRLVKTLTDPKGDFIRADRSYSSLFANLLQSLKISFSTGVNLSSVKEDEANLDLEINSLKELVGNSKSERRSYFDKLREEFVKRKYSPPNI